MVATLTAPTVKKFSNAPVKRNDYELQIQS